MAFVRDETSEVFLKVLYFGASGAGKTTNLQDLFRQSSANIPFKHFDLAPFEADSPFFEFIPLDLGEVKKHKVRLHAFTVPANDIWESVLFNLVSGVDGVVFVLDSRVTALQESERHYERMLHLLRKAGRSDLPLVLQYNHRDAATAVPVAALNAGFAKDGVVGVEAVASKGIGVQESIGTLLDQILAQMNDRKIASHARLL